MALPGQDIDNDLGEFGDLVSIEAFTALADAMNQCLYAVQVGEIATIMIVDGMTPELDATIWRECTGGLVTEPLSPIFNVPVPDMRDKYLKGVALGGTIGQIGGSNAQNFAHIHTGTTSTFSRTRDTDDSSGEFTFRNHAHAFLAATQGGVAMGDINMEPAHFTIKHFLKIR